MFFFLGENPRDEKTNRKEMGGIESDGTTETRRGSEKKQGQDEPIEKWLVRQGLIGWEKNLG